MNRRAFIQGLIGLASMPMISKYINVFKPAAVREGITKAADNTMQKGIEFYEAVIKRVIDEGTIVSESDRVRTYKHPDKPDIDVEVNLGTGDTSVNFESDVGFRAGAEITTDLEAGPASKELMEGELVYRGTSPEGDYTKDWEEEITGGITNLEDWIKMKRGYAAGGRVGRWMGGPLSAGKSTLREMLRHMSKGSSHGKSGAEMLQMVNPKNFSRHLEDPNLLFMKGSSKEGMMATDMVKDMVRKVEAERTMMIDELLQAAKNIRKADKSIEQYRMEMIEAMMAKGADRATAESLARVVSAAAEGMAGKRPTPKLTDEGILELETIHKNLLTKGRQLNATGGRVGMFRGGIPKGLAAALKTIRGKFGKGAIHQADEVVVDGDIYKAADPNRPPTEVEIETKYEALMDPDGGLPYYTIGELDNALVEAKAYEKEMFRQYKSGELDKYVKPEVLEESRTAFQNKINNQLEKTYDDIAGGSGFTGDDYKYDAQILADGIAEDLGLVWDNLSNERQAQLYNAALARISKDMAMKRALRKASTPTKTLEGIEKTGTINISDPNVAEEFARFMKETDPKGAKKVDEIVELMNFDPKGRKKNAKGGHIKDDADVSLTIIEIPDISESGVESLFKRR